MRTDNVNGHIIQGFILCTCVDIDREKTEKHPACIFRNLSYAIDLLKKLYNHSQKFNSFSDEAIEDH